MENNTYLKFGVALIFIIIYGFASFTVYLDKRKMKKTKNIDIEKHILNSSSKPLNKKKLIAQQPKVYSCKNKRMKNEVVDKNEVELKNVE